MRCPQRHERDHALLPAMRVALDAVERSVTAGGADWISATAPRGHKLLARAPHGRRRTLAFLLPALRCDRTGAPPPVGCRDNFGI